MQSQVIYHVVAMYQDVSETDDAMML